MTWPSRMMTEPTMASTTSKDTTPKIALIASLPLDGCRGFARHVIGHAVDAAHLVDDAAGHLLQQAIRQLGPIGRHEIAGLYRSERHHIVVGAAVSHHADALHR